MHREHDARGDRTGHTTTRPATVVSGRRASARAGADAALASGSARNRRPDDLRRRHRGARPFTRRAKKIADKAIELAGASGMQDETAVFERGDASSRHRESRRDVLYESVISPIEDYILTGSTRAGRRGAASSCCPRAPRRKQNKHLAWRLRPRHHLPDRLRLPGLRKRAPISASVLLVHGGLRLGPQVSTVRYLQV